MSGRRSRPQVIPWIAGFGLTIALVAALAMPNASAAITRDQRAGIKAAVHKIGDPHKVCSRLTESFLELNYGAGGAGGRKQCRKEVRRLLKTQPSPGFDRIHIVKATEDRARVRVVDTDGDRAALLLVKTPRGWLLDDIAALKELGNG